MSDTDLIVPVQVHALLVNRKVRTLHPFHRPQPSFDRMLGTQPKTKGRGAAEPEAFTGGKEVGGDAGFEGVHLQWQLPEALTDGFVPDDGQDTHFPLVPNRWLVVRYAWVRGARKVRGWVVHSDYLYSDDEGASWDDKEAINSFVDPRREEPEVDWLGRRHVLTPGTPWREPEAKRSLFLNAAGAGLPNFAAFEPYHENVFALHDDLQDLRDPAHGDSYPPDAELSYLVAGWYSDTDHDFLRAAAAIPGLLPPDASPDSAAEVVAALGWTLAGRGAAVAGGLGTAAGHGVEHLLDHQDDTYYLSANAPVRSDRITVDLGTVQDVSSLRVLAGDPDDAHLLPAVRVQTSVDGTDWPAAHHQDYDAGTPVLEYSPATPVRARYVQLWLLEAGPEPVAVRTFEVTAAPALGRSVYHGTALGLEWRHDGDAPEDRRPDPNRTDVAFGHSTGEAAAELFDRQSDPQHDSPRTAQLLNALYHGTLDTFDGPDGDRDLAETTRRSWFSGSEGGHRWQILARPDQDPGAGSRRAPAVAPEWLARLNADQAEHDSRLRELTEHQWRVWALHWLRHLPEGERPPQLPEGFDDECDRLLEPANDGPAKDADDALRRIEELRGLIPWPEPGQDLQDVADTWAAERGLDPGLQLRRQPGDAFYKPADPVLLINGSGGGTVPLTRDRDNPLPCRLGTDLLREVMIGSSWSPVEASPPDPGLTGLPAACAALLKEFALLERAARTADGARTALHAVVESPATRARGPLAEYTAPWRQPWLPMTLMWKLSWFPTPYRSDGTTHWTFSPPDDGIDAHHYTWDGTGTLAADFESEGDVLNRLFRSRAYLAPTTVYVLREQLARYRASHPGADRAALAGLRRELEPLDVLSQTLDGFNDWLLQLDGGAQVPVEGAVAGLAGPQNHVPDPATGAFTDRHQPIRAGQLFLTDLRLLDRFGRCVDLVTSGDEGNWYDQYPVLTASVTPSRALYTDPAPVNPERFVQLPPRLLQDTRLAFTQEPSGRSDGLAGWLLVNHLDQALGVYAPDGAAVGDVRIVLTPDSGEAARCVPLPHSPYTGHTDPRLLADHPELAGFLAGLIDRPDSAGAFRALVATVDRSVAGIVDTAPESGPLPARLIGRPVALVHATLDLELHHQLPTDPSWDTVLEPVTGAHEDEDWNIRLGDPERLDDGLIGYFAGAPGERVDYGLLRALDPAADSDYLDPVTDGGDLALPARPPVRRRFRRVTMIAHPHLPVHATTDILPVHALRLDAEQVHRALGAIRASFRLNPLLATTRDLRRLDTTMAVDPAHPLGNIAGRAPAAAEFRSLGAPAAGSTVVLDLGSVQRLAGYSLLTGTADGSHRPGNPVLEYSERGEPNGWRHLPYDAEQAVNEHTLDEAVPARYVRLRLTTGADGVFGMRRFAVTCDPDDAALLLPPLSARYGTWSWAQPQATATDDLDWDERPLFPADHLSHPDDPAPTARAGYLQLHPAAPNPPAR
ncbi:discoidin domain-containing protein [Kitasatospora sp. NPDC059146]|uniref:discoidin domain-containing protein n=1 Tax=Kitasatospora sp. NPDC059146 TaxID=3346741 RepID=UPI0036C309FA